MKISEWPIERLAAFVVVGAGAFLLLYFFLAPVLAAALPFLLAWGLAYLVRRPAGLLARRLRLPVGAVSVALVFLLLFLCGGGLFWLLSRAASELFTVAANLAKDGDLIETISSDMRAWWDGVLLRFPLLSSLGEMGEGGTLDTLLSNLLAQAVKGVGSFAARAAGVIASALPSWVLFLFVCPVAAYYFARDLDGIHRSIVTHLPAWARAPLLRLKEGALHTALGYFRAYLLLMFVTFLLLFVGFLLLGVRYALLLAALFALLDFLPVIGVGTLLLPWSLFSFFCGDLRMGIGLVVLYAIITAVRQFLEPRVVGRHLGMHPLLALISMYAGLKLFGFWGLMLLPAALLTLRHVFSAREEKG